MHAHVYESLTSQTPCMHMCMRVSLVRLHTCTSKICQSSVPGLSLGLRVGVLNLEIHEYYGILLSSLDWSLAAVLACKSANCIAERESPTLYIGRIGGKAVGHPCLGYFVVVCVVDSWEGGGWSWCNISSSHCNPPTFGTLDWLWQWLYLHME